MTVIDPVAELPRSIHLARMPLPLFLVFISLPAAGLIWASVHGLRVGKAPVILFAVSLDRRTHPRLYWALMALTIAAAVAATLVAGWLVTAALQ